MSQGFTGYWPLPWTVGNGGTGQTSLAAHTVLVGAGTSPVTQVGPGVAGQFLVSGGPSADPIFRVLATGDIPWGTPGVIGGITPNTAIFGTGVPTTSTTTGDLQVINGLGVGGRVTSTSHTLTQLATPATPTGTAVGTGGTLAAGTNFAKIVAIDGNGKQTVASAESASVTTVLNGSINWAWTAVPGAQSYQIWVSTATGTEANYFTSTMNAFTQTAPPSSGTAGTIPTVNSTGSIVGAGTAKFGNNTASTSTTTGDLVVAGGVGVGGQITAIVGVFGGVSVGLFPQAGIISDPGAGLMLRAKTGTTYDFALVNAANNAYVATVATGTNNLSISNNLSVGGTLGVSGVASFTNATASTSTTTGAAVITGGLGVGGAVYAPQVVIASGVNQSAVTGGFAYGVGAGSEGIRFSLATGSAYDLTIANPGNSAYILQVPTGTVNVNFLGRVTTAGRIDAIVKKTGAYTVVSTDFTVEGDATTASFTITLPASPATGEKHSFIKTDSSANTVTISGNGKNINGSATNVLSLQYSKLTVQYDGTIWIILA